MENIEELNRLIKESKDISGIIDEIEESGKGLFEQLTSVNIKSYYSIMGTSEFNDAIKKLLTPLPPDHPNQFKWVEPSKDQLKY